MEIVFTVWFTFTFKVGYIVYKMNVDLVLVVLQKARLARIRIAKASSGAAFVSKKKAAEARLAAQESGLEMDESYREEDIFELQHHHLLRCLEKTTVSFSASLVSACSGTVGNTLRDVGQMWQTISMLRVF